MKKKSLLATDKKSSSVSFEQAAKLAGQVRISDFRLMGCKSSLDLRKVASAKDLPKQVTQKVELAFKQAKPNKDIRYLTRFTFEARYPDQEPKSQPAIAVEAQFTIKYSRIKGRFDLKEIESAGNVVAALHCWPYWREFLQSMTARMGLPSVQIPLLNVSDLVEDDDD